MSTNKTVTGGGNAPRKKKHGPCKICDGTIHTLLAKHTPESLADFKARIAGMMRDQSADDAALSPESKRTNPLLVRKPGDVGYDKWPSFGEDWR